MSSSHRNILIALFVTTFLAAIEGTIVSTAMPAITEELNGMAYFSWVNSVYLLAMAVSATLYGQLSDIYGRKPLILVGTIIFTIGSALCGIAWDMVSLIIFRGIQGLGGAALISLPMIIIADLFSFDKIAKLQGLISSVWGVAGILGPLAGGLIVDYVSWRAVFYINVPFAVIAIFLIVKYLPAKEASDYVKIDVKGIILFSTLMLLLLYGLSELRVAFEYSVLLGLLNCSMIVLSFTLAVFFYRYEKRVINPFIAPSLLQNKLLFSTILVGFLISMITIAVIFYIPLWLQDTQGYSATLSGIAMIPLSITWPLSSLWAGYLLPKLGLAKINLLGISLLFISALGFASLTPATSLIIIMVYVAIAGAAYGLIFTAGTILSSVVTPIEQRGTAMSIVQVARTLGQTIGLSAWGLFIYANQADISYQAKLGESLHLVFILIGILSLVIVCYIVYSLSRYKSQYDLAVKSSL